MLPQSMVYSSSIAFLVRINVSFCFLAFHLFNRSIFVAWTSFVSWQILTQDVTHFSLGYPFISLFYFSIFCCMGWIVLWYQRLKRDDLVLYLEQYCLRLDWIEIFFVSVEASYLCAMVYLVGINHPLFSQTYWFWLFCSFVLCCRILFFLSLSLVTWVCLLVSVFVSRLTPSLLDDDSNNNNNNTPIVIQMYSDH
jgi:hypothetical protein